jgi:hypothetical protein
VYQVILLLAGAVRVIVAGLLPQSVTEEPDRAVGKDNIVATTLTRGPSQAPLIDETKRLIFPVVSVTE